MAGHSRPKATPSLFGYAPAASRSVEKQCHPDRGHRDELGDDKIKNAGQIYKNETEILKALNAEREARRAAIVVTDNGDRHPAFRRRPPT